MYDGKAIANLVLDYSEDNGIEVTNLSLQKIVYFCHVWYLISTGKPLIKHKFEAWEFGPVLPYLYREFSNFDDRPINGRAKKLDPKTGKKTVATLGLESYEKDLLDRIIGLYCRLHANQLVELSHLTGGPWEKVWNHTSKINPGMQINDEDIKEFYSLARRPFSLQ